MTKELWICIVIVILICVGDFFTQKYTKLCINEADSELRELRRELMQENVDAEKTKTVMNELQEKWGKRHPKLSYYIEHDELEKIDTAIVSAKTYIETEDYSSAATELDVGKFVLEHIQRKYAFNLVNVF